MQIASHRFKELYNIKKAASSLRARVGQFRQTLAAVLADDRKLAGMSLSLKAEARSEEAVADGAFHETAVWMSMIIARPVPCPKICGRKRLAWGTLCAVRLDNASGISTMDFYI